MSGCVASPMRHRYFGMASAHLVISRIAQCIHTLILTSVSFQMVGCSTFACDNIPPRPCATPQQVRPKTPSCSPFWAHFHPPSSLHLKEVSRQLAARSRTKLHRVPIANLPGTYAPSRNTPVARSRTKNWCDRVPKTGTRSHTASTDAAMPSYECAITFNFLH